MTLEEALEMNYEQALEVLNSYKLPLTSEQKNIYKIALDIVLKHTITQ